MKEKKYIDKEKKKRERQIKKDAQRTKNEINKAERERFRQEKAMMAISTSNEEGEKKGLKQKFLKSKLFDHLWIMNPKNLAKEVHVYGYNFSWKSHLILMLCCILGISSIGFLFQLDAIYFILSIVAVIVAIPSGVRYMYRQMFEQKRFADITTYMEQMLYSFQKNHKILSSLEEAKELFEEGSMRNCIDKAIAYLKEGKSGEDGLLREALAVIEERYPCVKLTTVHELFINSEMQGGDNEDSIILLLNDIGEWKKRGYELQANKKMLNTENIASIVVATALCFITLFVLDQMDEIFPATNIETNIFRVTAIQISSTVFILIMIITYLKSMKKLTVNWLQSEEILNEKVIMDSYKMVTEYDEAKQRKKSFLFATPFAIASIVSLAYQKEIFAVIFIAIAVFMLQQHNIGYKLALQDVNKALYLSLPQWFMQLSLLLQHNNVQVSLAKSINDAPMILKPELEKLMIRLADKPNELKSYTDFCKKFDVPEAQSCMKMLHAISVMGVGDVQKQIENIIERVNDMQDIADQKRNEDIKFSMQKIFFYPVGSATIKLLIDMTVGMLFMFKLLGSMGGI